MKFAVLDDSLFFLKAMEMEWQAIGKDYSGLEGLFIRLTEEREFSGQITSLTEFRHLLLDVSALDEGRMQTLADTLPNTTFWMMTGKAKAEEVERWQQWTRTFPHAQAQWFEKPLSLEETVFPVWLAETPLRDEGSPLRPELLDELNTFPIPCRWFNAECAAIHNNAIWRIALDANPNRFGAEDIAQLRQGGTITLDTWSERPEEPGHFGKVRYITRAWREGFLQFALPLPKVPGDSVHQAVSDLFELMLGSGSFTRARYYEILRVPGSPGVLRLCQASYDLDVTLPAQQPMGPTLAKRVGEYDLEFAKLRQDKDGKGKLINKIREHENELENTDADIQYWRKHANTGSAPWLALPVCKRKQAEASGLLIFDRLGKIKGADDYDGEGISHELVQNLAPKLLGGIQHLREVMDQEDVRQRLERRERMAEWRKKFAAQVDQAGGTRDATCLTALEQEILGAAKALTGADSALLALRPPAANYLESRTYQDELMAGLRLDYNRPHFIAVQCALANQSVYVPDYRNEVAITEDDWRDALAHLPQSEQGQRLPKLVEWQKNELGSVIALPVSYDATLLGVLVLRHTEPYFFTEEKVNVAKSLVNEAHPFLRRARALTARDAWDSMIFHEMRSGLSHIRAQADWVLHPSRSKSPEAAAQAILARSELMTDLSNEILFMLGYPDKRTEPRRYERTHPIALLHKLWPELATLPEAANKTLEASGGCLSQPLHDPNNVLPHVVRVLLENAMRYGKPGLIQASQSGDATHWRLCLCNPGQFSEDILKGRFKGLVDREDLAQDSLRAHIGLASCRRVLEGLGGCLDLKNKDAQDTGQPHACVTLIWPYALAQIVEPSNDIPPGAST